jgi:hypothetical protein
MPCMERQSSSLSMFSVEEATAAMSLGLAIMVLPRRVGELWLSTGGGAMGSWGVCYQEDEALSLHSLLLCRQRPQLMHRIGPAFCSCMAKGVTSEAFTSHAPQEVFVGVGACGCDLSG